MRNEQSRATPKTRRDAKVIDLAMHRELRRLGLIAHDEPLTLSTFDAGNDALVDTLDAFNAPMVRSLGTV